MPYNVSVLFYAIFLPPSLGLLCNSVNLFPFTVNQKVATVDMFREITFTYQFYVLAEIHFQDAHELVFQAEIHVHV